MCWSHSHTCVLVPCLKTFVVCNQADLTPTWLMSHRGLLHSSRARAHLSETPREREQCECYEFSFPCTESSNTFWGLSHQHTEGGGGETEALLRTGMPICWGSYTLSAALLLPAWKFFQNSLPSPSCDCTSFFTAFLYLPPSIQHIISECLWHAWHLGHTERQKQIGIQHSRLPNRTAHNEGNGLYLHCPIQWSIITYGYWNFKIFV